MRDATPESGIGIKEEAEKKYPGLSANLAKRIDFFGNPILKDSNIGQYKDDPVFKAFIGAGYAPSVPKREMLKVKLSNKEYEQYCRYAGAYLHESLKGVVTQAYFINASQKDKFEILKQNVLDSRRSAQDAMLSDTKLMARVNEAYYK